MKPSAQNISALVPLNKGGEGRLTINARDLHGFLHVGKDFSNWIKDQIDQWGFVEGQDYLLAKIGEQSKRGIKHKIEYHLSLDMAKELSMVSRNTRGREARRYFIECEKRLQRGQEAFSGLTVESLIRELQRRMWEPGIMSGLLQKVLPSSRYGDDGRFGFRRAAWVKRPHRLLEAAKLATQLQLFELLGEEGLELG